MYNDAMSYASFLSDQMVQDAKFDAYIQECVLISEGKNTIENMRVLTESFGDKIKMALAKVVEVFTRLCGKFMETVDTLFRSNKGYLEKYKDVILKNKPIDTKWSMYDWAKGMKECLNTPIPEFNYDVFVKEGSFNDKNAFISKYFAGIMKGQKDGTKLEEAAKFRFRGDLSEEREVAESALNITDMYNFCIRYDTMKQALQKDIDNVVKAAKDCQDKISKMAREAGNTPVVQGPTPPVKETVDYYLNDNRQYYSFVYEGYVVEAKKMDDKSAETNGASNDHSQPATNQSNGSTHETDPSKAMARIDKDKNTSDTTAKPQDSKMADEMVEAIKTIYIDSCTAVSAAKMQCIETAYKDYMDIIKNKVRTYVGTDDKNNKQQADTATNQKTNTEDQAKSKEADDANNDTEKNLNILQQGWNKGKEVVGNVIDRVTGKGKEEPKQ